MIVIQNLSEVSNDEYRTMFATTNIQFVGKIFEK